MIPQGAIVRDIGSKNTKGRYAFDTGANTPRVIAPDIETQDGVDFVGDVHRLPMKFNSVECVVCVSTFRTHGK